MKKPNKIIKILVAGLCIVGLCILLLLFVFREKDFNSFVTPSKVNQITIMSGSNGNTMNITKEEEINQILNYMDNITYQRKFAEDRTGWNYRFIFNQNDQPLADFVFQGDLVDINHKDYSVKDSNTITMDELVKALPDSIFK